MKSSIPIFFLVSVIFVLSDVKNILNFRLKDIKNRQSLFYGSWDMAFGKYYAIITL
jgi:hypothetical protein